MRSQKSSYLFGVEVGYLDGVVLNGVVSSQRIIQLRLCTLFL